MDLLSYGNPGHASAGAINSPAHFIRVRILIRWPTWRVTVISPPRGATFTRKRTRVLEAIERARKGQGGHKTGHRRETADTGEAA